jgi:glycerol-3-phosphate O-acyltransferase / dihydroxyacetone phosphate acyltransferase
MAAAGPALPLIRALARAITAVFYRVDEAGSVPSAGPVLLLPNHPNALLDPAVIWATAGRDIRFLAKSTLFDGLFAPILNGAGAIPVYRRLDQGVDASRNIETFAAVQEALAHGDAVCLFPEGVSHSTGRLEPLRTGAARMAIGAEQQGTRVSLVAVGLNFDRKTAFRSRMTVLYGPPFAVSDLAGETDGVRLATERIADQMRRLLVEADPGGDAAMVARVERLYSAARGRPRSPEERVARQRAIARGIERLRAADPVRFGETVLRLRRYDQRLRRFGLRDRHLDWDVSPGAAIAFALREIAVALLLFPIGAIGFVLFWVPYQLTGLLARRATSERDVAATAKVFVGAGVYTAWLLVIAIGVGTLLGAGAGILAAALIPALAVAGLFAIERETAVADTIRAWWFLRRARRQTRARLREARSDLAALLDEIYEWLSAETRAQADGRMPN